MTHRGCCRWLRTINTYIIVLILKVTHRNISRHTWTYQEWLITPPCHANTVRHPDTARHRQQTGSCGCCKIQVITHNTIKCQGIWTWWCKVTAINLNRHVMVSVTEFIFCSILQIRTSFSRFNLDRQSLMLTNVKIVITIRTTMCCVTHTITCISN